MGYDVSVIVQWVGANIEGILIGLSATVFIALVIFIQINVKLSRLLKKYNVLMRGMEGKNLEHILVNHVQRVDEAMIKVDGLSNQCQIMADVQARCLQRVGIIRFRAFQDTGSDLSFSIALLNAKDDGVVISSLFGREESRTYGKPIKNGESPYLLTEEEQQALQIAKQNK